MLIKILIGAVILLIVIIALLTAFLLDVIDDYTALRAFVVERDEPKDL
jgi:hypothetical protein